MSAIQVWLMLGIGLVAMLYASVGQAGASGYVAVMALLGVASAEIKPTALMLNTVVAIVVSHQFLKQKKLDRKLFWQFTAPAIPMAMLGGYITLPVVVFEPLLGLLLILSGFLSLQKRQAEIVETQPVHWGVALLCGATIGLLSGLTGVGGGVLLAPLLIYFRWATVYTAVSISALFILCNSVAALAGYWMVRPYLPPNIGPMVVVVVLAGWFGAKLGSQVLSAWHVQRLLSGMLILTGMKLIFL